MPMVTAQMPTKILKHAQLSFTIRSKTQPLNPCFTQNY